MPIENEWTKKIKELEKYKKIVDEIIGSGYFSTIDTNYIKNVKEKYFPGGVKNDER